MPARLGHWPQLGRPASRQSGVATHKAALASKADVAKCKTELASALGAAYRRHPKSGPEPTQMSKWLIGVDCIARLYSLLAINGLASRFYGGFVMKNSSGGNRSGAGGAAPNHVESR